MKKCPFCKEEIADDAVKCAHCKSDLSKGTAVNASGAAVWLSGTPNKELMAQARQALAGHWGLAVGAIAVYGVLYIGMAALPVAGGLISLFLSGALSVGLVTFSLAMSRGKNPYLAQIFHGFRKYGVALGASLLQSLFVMLWSLLLIIPGIIAGLSYAMTFYIIAENDSIGPLEAIRKSKTMMRGNRWKLFCLGCRFIGWNLLCICTLGIGFLWLGPYMAVSYARFYDDLQQK